MLLCAFCSVCSKSHHEQVVARPFLAVRVRGLFVLQDDVCKGEDCEGGRR